MNNTGEHYGIAGIIDVETTGLNPKYAEIIEFCIILFSYNRHTGEVIRIMDEYTGLREPSRPIPEETIKIHGITDADVYGKDLDYERISTLIQKADFLLAHNAGFDSKFVSQMFDNLPPKHWFCSLYGVKWNKHGYASKRLQYLIEAHGIKTKRAHRSYDDVKATLELVSKLNPQGEFYLKEILDYYAKRGKTVNQLNYATNI